MRHIGLLVSRAAVLDHATGMARPFRRRLASRRFLEADCAVHARRSERRLPSACLALLEPAFTLAVGHEAAERPGEARVTRCAISAAPVVQEQSIQRLALSAALFELDGHRQNILHVLVEGNEVGRLESQGPCCVAFGDSF